MGLLKGEIKMKLFLLPIFTIFVFFIGCGNGPTQTKTPDYLNLIGKCEIIEVLKNDPQKPIGGSIFGSKTYCQCDSITQYRRSKYQTPDTLIIGVFTENDSSGIPFVDTL